MPVVNRANYSPCPSCNRWMHAPLKALDGNRAHICQECYEKADNDHPESSVLQMHDASAQMRTIEGYVVIGIKDGRKYVFQGVHEHSEDAMGAAQRAIKENPYHQIVVATIGQPAARAKLEMPTDEECEQFRKDCLLADGNVNKSIRIALHAFVMRRNQKSKS